jgi:hypothetical protein
MIVAIILHICTLTECYDARLPIELTAQECQINGQMYAAQVIAEGERLAGWRCVGDVPA